MEDSNKLRTIKKGSKLALSPLT